MQNDVLNNLIKEHQSLIEAIVYRYCKNREDAKDLVSEIWAKVSMSIESYQENRDFVKWIAAIARNTCIDHLRKNSSNVSFETFDETKDPHPFTEQNNTLSKDRFDALQKAMSLLPEEDNLIIILHYFNGLSVKELNKRFNLSPNAAKVRLYRAREKLRDALKKIGYLKNIQ